MALPTEPISRPFSETVIDFAPGVLLSASVAIPAYLAAPWVANPNELFASTACEGARRE